MEVLFIVALVLAWPTFGLSIVVWIVLYLFKFSQRQTNTAWDSYETCLAHRRRKLAEFRVNAAREILLTHPDAKLLMNNNYRTFLAYSKKDEVLLAGNFNDENFPSLDFFNINDPETEIQQAVDNFKIKLEKYSPDMYSFDKKYAENPDRYSRMNPDVRRESYSQKASRFMR